MNWNGSVFQIDFARERFLWHDEKRVNRRINLHCIASEHVHIDPSGLVYPIASQNGLS